ncbi:hypothetical protein [Ancylobacter amanitiformis]|uniref:Drug/metabolite transporter (DMT)-like permease n=1 Tax=Ancylobacter amanitiformis TaxID=217069 RepID=A0ABU0LVL2_9HYPH|nr:hypothetical protein [Ancylobacter amanitiformis]MDQ0512738.1 drug/metabolite transporter (DMT)-like permease [Ancylobacter amanitiformis]
MVPAFGWAGAVSFRALIASATLFLVARAIGRRLDFSFGIVPLIMAGVTAVAGQLALLSYSLPLIGTAMSARLVAMIPLFSMLIARLRGWSAPVRPITPDVITTIGPTRRSASNSR